MAIQNPDIVIAVMGMTGAGKSSFIRRITRDQSIRVGDTLHSGKHNHFFLKKVPEMLSRPDRVYRDRRSHVIPVQLWR
jgi:ABC-type proline/glycine betaine transport system ATPase subunit